VQAFFALTLPSPTGVAVAEGLAAAAGPADELAADELAAEVVGAAELELEPTVLLAAGSLKLAWDVHPAIAHTVTSNTTRRPPITTDRARSADQLRLGRAQVAHRRRQ
jgi:hypothetical protein